MCSFYKFKGNTRHLSDILFTQDTTPKNIPLYLFIDEILFLSNIGWTGAYFQIIVSINIWATIALVTMGMTVSTEWGHQRTLSSLSPDITVLNPPHIATYRPLLAHIRYFLCHENNKISTAQTKIWSWPNNSVSLIFPGGDNDNIMYIISQISWAWHSHCTGTGLLLRLIVCGTRSDDAPWSVRDLRQYQWQCERSLPWLVSHIWTQRTLRWFLMGGRRILSGQWLQLTASYKVDTERGAGSQSNQ